MSNNKLMNIYLLANFWICFWICYVL